MIQSVLTNLLLQIGQSDRLNDIIRNILYNRFAILRDRLFQCVFKQIAAC